MASICDSLMSSFIKFLMVSPWFLLLFTEVLLCMILAYSQVREISTCNFHFCLNCNSFLPSILIFSVLIEYEQLYKSICSCPSLSFLFLCKVWFYLMDPHIILWLFLYKNKSCSLAFVSVANPLSLSLYKAHNADDFWFYLFIYLFLGRNYVHYTAFFKD